MIRFTHEGNFDNTENFFNKVRKHSYVRTLSSIAEEGVRALSEATPVDSGLTAASWSYTITQTKNKIIVDFINTNFNKGVPIAVIIQYGHATRNGGYVPGRDYINPAITPIFDKMAKLMWEEVVEKS